MENESFGGSVEANAGDLSSTGTGASAEGGSGNVDATVGLDSPSMSFATTSSDLGKVGQVATTVGLSALAASTGTNPIGAGLLATGAAFGVMSNQQAFANVGNDVANAATFSAAHDLAAIGTQQLLALGFQPSF